MIPNSTHYTASFETSDKLSFYKSDQHQMHPDTELSFSYAFGPNASPEQFLMLQTRFIDFNNRAAICINPDNVYIVNRGNSSNNANGSNVNILDNTPVPLYSNPGQWYDVLVRTVGDAMLVWIKEQDGIYGDWDTAITYLPPILAVDNLQTSASNYLRLILGVYIVSPHPFGGLLFDNHGLQTVACGGMPPALYTPCDDVVISEIFPHTIPQGHPGIWIDDVEYRDPWIELWNQTGSPVDISGWSLTDDPVIPDKYIFGPGSIIQNEYALLFLDDIGITHSINNETNFLALSCPVNNDQKTGHDNKTYMMQFSATSALQYSQIRQYASFSILAYNNKNVVTEDDFHVVDTPTPNFPFDYQIMDQYTWNLRLAYTHDMSNIHMSDPAELDPTHPIFDIEYYRNLSNSAAEIAQRRWEPITVPSNPPVYIDPGPDVSCPVTINISLRNNSIYGSLSLGNDFPSVVPDVKLLPEYVRRLREIEQQNAEKIDILLLRYIIATPAGGVTVVQKGARNIILFIGRPNTIEVDYQYNGKIHPKVLLHELGHYAGLGHDYSPFEEYRLMRDGRKSNDKSIFTMSDCHCCYFLGFWDFLNSKLKIKACPDMIFEQRFTPDPDEIYF